MFPIARSCAEETAPDTLSPNSGRASSLFKLSSDRMFTLSNVIKNMTKYKYLNLAMT